MAPVILELKKSADLEVQVIATGQHDEMLRQVLDFFDIRADKNLDVMKDRQTLAYLTAAILEQLDAILADSLPDIVIAQGDTTSTLVSAIAAFYRKVPFAHVEAGLRTDSVTSPFPEEFNRRAVALIATLHFAPTKRAAQNLIREGTPTDRIFVTGNTSIDSILNAASQVEAKKPREGKMILATTHRRENWGEPQRAICRALKKLVADNPDAYVVLSMHRNPAVREVLREELAGCERVLLIEPPEYGEFVSLMKGAELILTDSGGVQEEAPSLGKPVLVLRTETERPEGIESGNAVLVGTSEERIYKETLHLLDSDEARSAMSQVKNPYGDGKAARRIASRLLRFLDLPAEVVADFA